MPTDCASSVCSAGVCAAPTFTDGVKNGSESDIDCGGADAPLEHRCVTGKSCVAHGDCASDGCDYAGHCALGRSCTRELGGYSCGKGETGAADAEHESCCVSLPVTGQAGITMDKYMITAGRMREFVTRVDENVAGFIEANKPAYWHDEWTALLPTGHATPVSEVEGQNRNLGVVGQLGPNFLYQQPGLFGCFLGATAAETGAPTYYQPLADRQSENPNDVGHKYDQNELDQHALNCSTFLMFAAFCAWDGGRLPTIEEIDAAWGPAKYPWGATPEPAGYSSGYPNPAALTPAGGDPLRASFKKNYPQTPATWNHLDFDNASYIAPPGRFPTGAGPDGHMDLAGNLFDMTLTLMKPGGSPFDARTPPAGVDWGTTLLVRWSKSGSWEHAIPYSVHYSEILRKYQSAGARCVHELP